MPGHRIKLEDCKILINEIIDAVIAEHGEFVSPDQNFYWIISGADLFDMGEQPQVSEVGSLFDDIDFLNAAVASEGRAHSTLIPNLVGLLNFIAHRDERVSQMADGGESSNPH